MAKKRNVSPTVLTDEQAQYERTQSPAEKACEAAANFLQAFKNLKQMAEDWNKAYATQTIADRQLIDAELAKEFALTELQALRSPQLLAILNR